MSCAYLLNPDDSVTYLDVTGKSYLSSKPKKMKSQTCKNGHPVEHIHKNPNEIFMFSKEDGIGYCKACNYILDPKCMGI